MIFGHADCIMNCKVAAVQGNSNVKLNFTTGAMRFGFSCVSIIMFFCSCAGIKTTFSYWDSFSHASNAHAAILLVTLVVETRWKVCREKSGLVAFISCAFKFFNMIVVLILTCLGQL